MNFFFNLKNNFRPSIFYIPFCALVIDQISKYFIYTTLFLEFRVVKIFPVLNLVPV